MLLALGLATFGAVGQNVIVVMNDGTSQTFYADEIKELRFREVTETPPVEFKTIDVNAWSVSGVTLTFEDETGNVKFVTDLYGPAGEAYLHTGTYTCSTLGSSFTFDSDYTEVTLGEAKHTVTDGTIDVSLSGKVYTFQINMTLDNGEEFNGSWSGELPKYTPWITAEMSAAKYNENPQPAGTFYVKFNDADWTYEMALVFNADAAATALPAGTYKLSDLGGEGTLTSASYVSISSPYSEVRLMDGSEVTVAKDGEDYDITMNLKLSDGRTGEFSYKGKISGTPSFEIAKVVYNTIRTTGRNNGNTTILFGMEDDSTKNLELDFYGSGYGTYFETGEYVVGASSGLRVDTDPGYTYLQDGPKTYSLTGGKVVVTRVGGIYTFDIDVTLENGEKYLATFTGDLNSVYSAEFDVEVTVAEYNTNPGVPGEFYVKFHDAWYNCEMAIDFFSEASNTTLPAGEYVYSKSGEPGTFGDKSYVDLYFGPNSAGNKMEDGSKVTVTRDGNLYTIVMDLLFDDGRLAHITFSGAISGTPTFETPEPEPVVFTCSEYGSCGEQWAGTLRFGMGDSCWGDQYPKMLIAFWTNEPGTDLEAGEYIVGATDGLRIDPGNSSYYMPSASMGDYKNLESGKMTVSIDGDIFTFDMDFTLENGERFIGRYVGPSNREW